MTTTYHTQVHPTTCNTTVYGERERGRTVISQQLSVPDSEFRVTQIIKSSVTQHDSRGCSKYNQTITATTHAGSMLSD